MLCAPFELDLWQARDDKKAQYIAKLLGTMDTIRSGSRWARTEVAPMVMLWEGRLLSPK